MFLRPFNRNYNLVTMRGKDITEFNDRNDKLVRLRIKKCQASNKRTYFRLTGTVNKEHIDQQFKSKALALNTVYSLENRENAARSKLNSVVTELSGAQIADATAAIYKLPEGVALTQVVDFYLQHRPSSDELLAKAYDDYLAEKRRIGRRERTISDIEFVLKRFLKNYGWKMCSSIIREDAVKYIERGKVSAITQNNRQRVFNGFFNFCVKRDWMTDNPLAKYDLIKVRESETNFFSVDEVQIILSLIKEDTYKALMPYIILMLLCGLRNEETRRLKWEKLNFQSDHVYIRIDADVAKTNSRRIIQTTDAATRLLNYCLEQNLTELRPRNFRKRFDKLKAATGLDWRPNILRHTFGTYRYALSENAEATSKKMGNSPTVLKKYYDGLATKREAEKFFELKI